MRLRRRFSNCVRILLFGLKRQAEAMRIRFPLANVFPENDPLSVRALRLMIATDDARHLQKLLIIAEEDVDEANQVEMAAINGEMSHLFRMLCGHLYEAGVALRAIDQRYADLMEAAVASDEKGRSALARVREAYSVDPQGQAFHYSFLKPIRDDVGFHYKEEALNRALARLTSEPNQEGTVTVCEVAGLSRFNVSDHLVAMVICALLNVPIEELQENLHEKMQAVIKLAGHLALVVDLLAIHLFETRRVQLLERAKTTVTIPAQVLQARVKVEMACRGTKR